MCFKGLRNLIEEYQAGLEYTLLLGKVTNSSEGEGGEWARTTATMKSAGLRVVPKE